MTAEFRSDLDDLLAEWAASYRLSARQIARVRDNVLAIDTETSLDSDWFWSLLRPVTSLLEQTSKSGMRAFRCWPFELDDRDVSLPYLELA